jgi:D-methionine transport system substrate-binding protein
MRNSRNKKWGFLFAALLGLSLTFFGGESAAAEKTVVNVACRNDFPEIWDAVNKRLESENIVVINTGYDNSINLNELLLAGDIDMNVAQHYAYLDLVQSQNARFKDLIALDTIHIATLDLYSNKFKSVKDLPDGATVAIPNDVMNGGRALLILERAGLLTLNRDYRGFPDETNIAENPKNIQLLEIASASMVITLNDVDAGFVYSINAVDGGLDPIGGPIFRDDIDFAKNENQDRFVIIFTARSGDADNAVYRKIIDAYHSAPVYKLYKDIYKYSLIPIADGKAIDLDSY